ncbi:MAG: protein kinase [Planctomycetales bacterium]|nr:protein kinase [Planctomycetales bacterium]
MAPLPESSDNESHSFLGRLSTQEQLELTEILDNYLQQLEDGLRPSRTQILDGHPALADVLELYLDKLDQLYRVSEVAPSRTDLRGKILGDFQLECEIGRGGMGIVFAAQNVRLNRKVAVKLLPMAALLDDKHVERFKNEARAAAVLEHPNIVPVYAIGEEGGIHFFAMRLIDGSSLDRRVAEHQAAGTKPPTVAALRQFAAIADALHNAHEYGIVHRDIKPSNLLLDRNGKLWVADFGLARCQADRAITRTGEMIGTMRYMSPEQASGRTELVDHTTDIYSLGATLYEFLTLRPAIEGQEGPSLLTRIMSQPPVRLRKLRSDCPLDLQTVVEKAMAINKGDRYSTAAEFANDLRNVAEGNPITARPVSVAVRLARWTVAHSVGFATATILLLIAAIGLVTSNLLILHERDRANSFVTDSRAAVEELSMVADDLAAIPGAEQIRRTVLQTTLKYYERYTEQSLENSSLRADTANAYTKIGAILEELGKPAEAVTQYQSAEAIYAALHEREPDSVRYQILRNRNLNHLGLALATTGQTFVAIETLREAVERQESLGSEETTSLALAVNNYGLALQKGHRREAAKQEYQKAIGLLTQARRDAPEDQEIARGLAAAFQNFGALIGKDKPEEAVSYLKQALEIQLWLAHQVDNRLRVSRDLISTYLNLGNIHLENSHFKLAIDNFRDAALLGQKLVDISPEVASYRRDLAISLSNLGMSQYQDGDAKSAYDALEESETHYRELLKEHPANVGLRSSLGIALNNQAIVLQHLGKSQDAESAYVEAAEVLEAAQLAEPSTAHVNALERVYVNHARLLYAAGKEQQAAAIVERQIALKDANTHE